MPATWLHKGMVSVPKPIVSTHASVNPQMLHRVIANHRRTLALCALEDATRPADNTVPDVLHAVPLRQLPLIVTGDLVVVETDEAGATRATELIPRESVLERAEQYGKFKPLAANLTHLGIVSAAPPGIDTLLIDEFCVAARRAGLGAIIIINKYRSLTLEQQAAADRLLDAYSAAGHTALVCEATDSDGMAALSEGLAGRVVALVGASGVGKSSIVQRLLPDRDIRVGAVSAATGLGSHTTSVTFWYDLPGAGALVDSPGVRRWSVEELSHNDVRAGFGDIAELAEGCRFNDCKHTVEPGCAVTRALEGGNLARFRYENYCKLVALP